MGAERMEASERFCRALWKVNGVFESKSKIPTVTVVAESNIHEKYYLLASFW